MREITAREKVFLGIGILVALAIFVYFVFWPRLQGGQMGKLSGTMADLDLGELQERLEAMERLEDMGPLLVDLQNRMRLESGYADISFKPGIAGSMIFNYLAQAANKAGIKDLEQVNPKPDTSRKTVTRAKKEDQAILESVVNLLASGMTEDKTIIDRTVRENPGLKREDVEQSLQYASLLAKVVDRMYLGQVMDEVRQASNNADEGPAEGDPSNADVLEETKNMEPGGQDDFDASQLPPAALEFLKERDVSIEELEGDPELREKLRKEFEAQLAQGEGESLSDDQMEEPAAPSMPEEPEPGESSEDIERAKSKKLIFPPLPDGNIPSEVKQSLARFVETHQGKTTGLVDMSLDEAGVEDEDEVKRVKKRLELYQNSVKKKKGEILRWLSKIDIPQDVKTGQKAGKFSVKMVFKSRMDQLVRFLYDLQNSAKWLKIESMRINISDREETLLSVELSMIATTLYE